MKNFIQLKRNLKTPNTNQTKIKVALLGDTATQFLNTAIKGRGIDLDYDLDIFEADFDQIERQVLDPTSELYEFAPELVIIFKSSHKLLGKYNKSNVNEYGHFAANQLDSTKVLLDTINQHLNTKIIYYNYTEIDDSVFGNFASKTEFSFLYQLRKLNYELMELATKESNLYLCDLSSIQNKIGKDTFFKPSIYINNANQG